MAIRSNPVLLIAALSAFSILAACGSQPITYHGQLYTKVRHSNLQKVLLGKRLEEGVEEYLEFAEDNTFFNSHDYGDPERGSYTIQNDQVCLLYKSADRSQRRTKCLFVLEGVADHKILLTDLKGFDFKSLR